MADDPQAQADDLIAVRYTDPAPRIINGEGRVQGDIIQLPASEVEAWPADGPHPYYERADQASSDRRQATGRAKAAPPAPPTPESAPDEPTA